VDDRGAPVAGACVEVQSGGEALDPIATGNYYSAKYSGKTYRFHVVTDVDGKFHVDRMPVGSRIVSVVARHPRHVPNDWSNYNGSSVDNPIVVQRGCTLRGRVIDGAGKPVPVAYVAVSSGFCETATDRDGRFVLGNVPGGTHTLKSIPRRHGVVFLEAAAKPEEPVDNLEFVVPPPAWLTGKVLDDSGAPATGVHVGWLSRAGFDSSKGQQDPLYFARFTCTDADGVFKLGPVVNGQMYQFMTFHAGYESEKLTASSEQEAREVRMRKSKK
jgi:hypothetical protein